LLRMLSWRQVLGMAMGMAALVAIVLVAGAMLLVLTPIVFVAAMIGRWLMGRQRGRFPDPQQRPDLIEGRYEVIDVATSRDRRFDR